MTPESEFLLARVAVVVFCFSALLLAVGAVLSFLWCPWAWYYKLVVAGAAGCYLAVWVAVRLKE